MAAGAQELAALARELQGIVGRFELATDADGPAPSIEERLRRVA
jgi:hypothetical protein